MDEQEDTSFKIFRDGSALKYASGRFDKWQVQLKRPTLSLPWYPPSDIQYFKILQDMGKKYGNMGIYSDFVTIYNLTNKVIDNREEVFAQIESITTKYGSDSLDMEIWLSVLYMAMIAEENKIGTRLGKRIKRLGVHRALIENVTPKLAADENKGKDWRSIDIECKKRGF